MTFLRTTRRAIFAAVLTVAAPLGWLAAPALAQAPAPAESTIAKILREGVVGWSCPAGVLSAPRVCARRRC